MANLRVVYKIDGDDPYAFDYPKVFVDDVELEGIQAVAYSQTLDDLCTQVHLVVAPEEVLIEGEFDLKTSSFDPEKHELVYDMRHSSPIGFINKEDAFPFDQLTFTKPASASQE